MEKTRIAKVRLLSTAKATDRIFDYLCPWEFPVFRGAVVKIPFGKGNRETFGIVVGITDEVPSMTLKSIVGVFPQEIGLSEELLELCDHLREQIFCTFGDAARAIIPSPVYQKKAKTVRSLSLSEGVDPETALDSFRGKNKEKYIALLRYLSLTDRAQDKLCRELFALDSAAIATLEKKGLIRSALQEEHRDPFDGLSDVKRESGEICLSPAQKEAFEKLRALADSGKAAGALLHGITGSGKTQVMLALCDHILKQGKTVLFLVPEIALTGQSARILFARYGEKVAVLHSALSEGERRDTYVSIGRGEKPIVLGTRSAVFAPVRNLGLILIDEEQDGSYKSDTGLKYHARDVARFRCAKNNALLLLASATPDIESYYKAESGAYTLVSLTERYGSATLPTVQIVDLRPEKRKDPSLMLGKRLREEIANNLEAGEQTILLMNRRGYRRFVSCMDCGEVIRCPNCSVSMTLHNTARQKLSCHYCGYAEAMPDTCPHCGSKHLVAHGFGIQQLEEELLRVFPEARLLRLDSDTIGGKDAHDEILSAFRNREADILIGTQMVAKGHNFPWVTLVGIVMADSALYLSDYRAPEHTFSLLTQVIGRAGRAEKKGRALIQTLNPRHNVFSLASDQNYVEFYRGEIALRKEFTFPPFCQIAVFTIACQQEREVLLASKAFSDKLERNLSGEFSDVKMIVYGPFEAPVYRLKNIYRKRFIIKYKNNPRSRALLDRLLTEESDPRKGGAKVTLDIGPGLV
ncbi:MAG: primosomal protein N' [Clostridia bacterium]|nr:primosomal protein N' [Clostridia bacterium]